MDYLSIFLHKLSGYYPLFSFIYSYIWYCAIYDLRRKQQAGNLHTCKNEINNSSKNPNLLVELFILKYFLFFSLWTNNKTKNIIYTHTHTHTHTVIYSRPKIRPIYEYVKTFIEHIGFKKHEIGSATKLLFTFLSLRFSDMRRERNNFLLYWLFHLIPSRAAPRHKILVLPRWAPKIVFLPVASNLNSLFPPNSQIPSPPPPGTTPSTPPPTWGLHCNICDCHTRPARAHANTRTQCVHPTNPRTKSKGPQPNQTERQDTQKEKWQHKKSLCNYIITHTHARAHIYIYIYIYKCVCVCVCVYVSALRAGSTEYDDCSL